MKNRATSPPVANHFSPEMTNPSPSGRASVPSRVVSEPASGSVTA
jgi:hypothetical protein